MWQNLLFEIVRIVISFFVLITLFKNITFLLIAPFYPIIEKRRYLKQIKKRLPLKKLKPKISIIVPAWNEEVGIRKTIKSVVENQYDNFELIVVDDGSTDKTKLVVEQYIKNISTNKKGLSTKMKLIHQKNGGKGVALNNGIANSTGDIILTLDADSALKKGALSNLVKYYYDDNIKAVVGSVEVANVVTFIGFAQQIEYYFGFYNKRAHAVLGAEYIFGGGMCFVSS